MRIMSCNGCRVLRKGCSDDCTIKPCLEWINTPHSQANATIFLAKFYGRAGLINLINAAPPHLRTAVFRSLLYESCGRIVNPIYGSVGLMGSGNWHLCHTAVQAVLRGASVTQMATEATEAKDMMPPLKAYDIRHVNKEEKLPGSGKVHRVRNRSQFKRYGARSKRVRAESGSEEGNGSLSHQSEAVAPELSLERESFSWVGNPKPASDSITRKDLIREEEGEIELELTLGLEPLSRCMKAAESRAGGLTVGKSGFCKVELRLDSLVSS